MTVKCISKAAYLEEKMTGKVMSQEDKILEIIAIGGDWSLKEIKAAYTAKWGDIETSSVSARCNALKDPSNPKIFEVRTRKCSISDKVINALSAIKCSHNRYRQKDYMCHPKALKDTNIAWIGMIVEKCEDCGQDISFAKRAPVLTAEQYLRGLDHGQNKGKRKRG